LAKRLISTKTLNSVFKEWKKTSVAGALGLWGMGVGTRRRGTVRQWELEF
jgi:hypothetical protein